MGKPFVIKTDNWANKHIQTQAHLDRNRMARWAGKLQEYDFVIEHIPGDKNMVADVLSRRADYSLGAALLVDARAQFLAKVRGWVEADPEYQARVAAVSRSKHPEYSIVEGLLYFRRKGQVAETPRLYIPAGELRAKLLFEAHDARIAGHLGRDKHANDSSGTISGRKRGQQFMSTLQPALCVRRPSRAT
jgi:hypothetical protein